MRQPELGLKVSDLRGLKGITQEKLAEYCEVSTRTIQRIENGEVEPRAFTRNSLSNILEFDLSANEVQNETFWLAAMHLSNVICILIIPLLIWSWGKNKSYKIDKQGRNVLNFQITVTLLLFAGMFILLFLLPGLLIINRGSGTDLSAITISLLLVSIIPMIAIGFFAVFEGVANTVRVLSDKPYHYPLSIPFIK